MRIKIHDWDTHFEADRSRQWKKLSWVPIPNKQGLGYKKIMSDEKGAQIFGCWIAIVEQASICSPRGDLSKYSITDLSIKTMIPELILKSSIEFIIQHLDWIEVIENLDKNVNDLDKNVSDPPVVSSMLCSSMLYSSSEGGVGETKLPKMKPENSSVNNERITVFDCFRKQYPGSKRGLNTEYDNFRKKHRDYISVIPVLEPALINQIKWRSEMKTAGMFIPEWKNLQTWINQRCWEMEKPAIEKRSSQSKERPLNEYERNAASKYDGL